MFRKKTSIAASKEFLEHEIKKRINRISALPTNLIILDDSFCTDERKKRSLEAFIQDFAFIEELLLKNMNLTHR